MHHDVPPDAVTRICKMLQGFETDNILENTVLLETLSTYGGLESPVTPDDALCEMRSTIVPNALTDPAVIEAAQAFGVGPGAFLASRASGCLSRIFEDIFQGAYCEAYFELSGEEKCAILSLASECPDIRFHSDWVLRELLEHGGRNDVRVSTLRGRYRRRILLSAQDATAAFVLAVEGCARWMDTPPSYTGSDTPSHRAWATIGEIFFWTHRKSEVARTLWSRFEGPTRLAAADVLYNIGHCHWKLDGDGRSPVNLLAMYPDDIQPIVANCVRGRESLPSAFNYGGSRNRRVVTHLIDILGKVGDEDSVPLLQELVDDLEFGRDAIHAIESIRGAVAQPAS